MEGRLQLAVSSRLPPPVSAPDLRYVAKGYRSAAAQPWLSFGMVNQWLIGAGTVRASNAENVDFPALPAGTEAVAKRFLTKMRQI